MSKVKSEKRMKNLKDTQVFTPSKITNQMLDLLDQSIFSKHETFFFEPSCGDGQMLVVVVDRIFEELLKKHNDKEQALADTLFKFYAIELDETLIPKARTKVFEWAKNKIGRDLGNFEMYLIARSLQNSIENRNFFEAMEHPIDAPSLARAISRKIKSATKDLSKIGEENE